MDKLATPHRISSLTHATTRDDVVQASKTVHDAWCCEIEGKIHPFDGDYDTYLNNFVPCVTPLPQEVSSVLENGSDPFESFLPVKGGEVASYDPLVDGLTKLVACFPKDKKLTFVNSNSLELKFPYAAFAHNHHPSKPDLAVSWPGLRLNHKQVKNSQWDKIIAVLEVKPLESNDSFQAHKTGKSNECTIIQVVRNARCLMHTHGLLYCFVIGVYGETVRIARFDHTCGIVCKAFNIKEGADILQRFFWHFVNPAAGGLVAGCDPTSYRLTSQDKEWVRDCLRKRDDPDANDAVFAENIQHGKRLLVHDEQTGKQTWYLAYKPIDINARLFSRATRVWRTIEDTRVEGKDGNLIADRTKKDDRPRVRILKESWRQLVRKSEGSFYQRLQSKIPKDQSHGLAWMECGGDLGQMEVRAWEGSLTKGLSKPQRELRLSLGPYAMPPLPVDDSNTSSDAPALSALPGSDVDPSVPACGDAATSSTTDQSTFPVDASESSTALKSTDLATAAPARNTRSKSSTTSTTIPTTPSNLGEVPESKCYPSYYYLPMPQQQTFTWTYLHGEKQSYRERSLMRFVMAEVGRPITEFKSTYELVRAFYDAIIGHKKAYEEAGILHRDISVGNIMIRDDYNKDGPVGFLMDFDYSSIVESMVEPKSTTNASTENNPTHSTNKGFWEMLEMEDAELVAFFKSQLQPPSVAPACQKERTGTFYFMAVEMLEARAKGVVHEPRHDLESFYWVLLWVVLRHTYHTLGPKRCGQIFAYGDNTAAADSKRGWITQAASLVVNSVPLTYLLEGFRALVHSNIHNKTGLSYSSVLKLFEKALDKKNWPADDSWIKCTLLDPSLPKTREGRPGSLMSTLPSSCGYNEFVAPRESIAKASPQDDHLPTAPLLPLSQASAREILPNVGHSAPAAYHNHPEETPTRPKRRRQEAENVAKSGATRRPQGAGQPVGAGSSRIQSATSSKRRKLVPSVPLTAMTLRPRRPRTPPGSVP